MSKATTKTTDDDGVHRLRDIMVEEVSLVDRPANKRKFLVVKRNEERKAMPTGAEVVTGPNGTLTTAAPTATPGATPPAGGATPEVAKAGCSLTKEMKQALSDVMTVALEGLGSAKEMVDSATEVGEVEKADVSALGQQLSDAADILLDTLEGLEAFLAPAQPDPAAANGQAAPGAPVQQRDPNAPTSLAKSLELSRAQGIVKRAEQVAKYGAKMSRGRLKVFEDTMKTLSSLLEELKAAPPPKPAAPGAAAAPPPSGDEDPNDPKKKPKKPPAPGAAPAAPAPPPPAAKSAETEDLKKAIAKLEGELRSKVGELANIRKGTAPTSNAAQPGSSPTEPDDGAAGGSYTWPMDMNDDVQSRTEKVDWMGD